MQNKQHYRNLVKKEFAKLSQEELLKRSTALVNKLSKNQILRTAELVMVYLPLKDEVQLQTLFSQKKQFYIPNISGPTLKPVKLYENTPINAEKLDLIIVPGCAYTKEGVRIGRGAGYYDRFLVGITIPTIALALSFQIFPELPQEKHDVLIQEVISE